VLFLTRAVPLRLWDRLGTLERETALYRRLLPHLGSVSLLTCGGPSEQAYEERLGGIRILPNRWGLGANAFSLLAPFLYRRELRAATVYKTNQLDGAWTAVLAKRLYGKLLIVRAGYLWALNTQRADGRLTPKGRLIASLERWAWRHADRAVVTTEALRQHVIEWAGVPADRMTVVPNYVDTDLFRPSPDARQEPGHIVFVGRLAPEKNLAALLEAVGHVPGTRLTLAGDGPLRAQLEAQAQSGGIPADFLGSVPNPDLPALLRRAAVFAQPSLYEGHPKSLLEAMACGCAVLGTDVPGIRDVIRDGKTGVLCGTSSDEIAAALGALLADEERRQRLGRAARDFVVQQFGLDRVMELELDVLRSLA
jgi:glycosyltransferase involved in cell wall biosynthesis